MTADSPPGGPWGRPAAPRPGAAEDRRLVGGLGSSLAGRLRAGGGGTGGLPLTTPLVWAWGGVLLTASTWLVGVIALFRGFAGLFD